MIAAVIAVGAGNNNLADKVLVFGQVVSGQDDNIKATVVKKGFQSLKSNNRGLSKEQQVD